MQMILVDKELWDVVERSEVESVEGGSKDNKWIVKDKKALATICLSVKDSELVHVRSCKTSAEAWKKLEEVYETKGLARRLFLRRKFFTAQLQDGESMQEHINKVTTLSEQLEAIGAKISDEDIAMTLLCSLPQSYENLIVALESRADSLTAEIVRTRLLQEEARRKENDPARHEEAALLAKNKGKKEGQWREESHQRNYDKRIKCFNCGKKGHKAAECREGLAEDESQAKWASTKDVAFGAVCAVGPRDDNEWYVDSGATQHLSSKKEWFSNFSEIEPRKIYLANNHAIVAKGIGTVHVQLYVNGEKKNGTFREVLYVPELHGNLLSVDKVVACGYDVLFKRTSCIVMNRKGHTIAVATKKGNLYRLVAEAQSGYHNGKRYGYLESASKKGRTVGEATEKGNLHYLAAAAQSVPYNGKKYGHVDSESRNVMKNSGVAFHNQENGKDQEDTAITIEMDSYVNEHCQRESKEITDSSSRSSNSEIFQEKKEKKSYAIAEQPRELSSDSEKSEVHGKRKTEGRGNKNNEATIAAITEQLTELPSDLEKMEKGTIVIENLESKVEEVYDQQESKLTMDGDIGSPGETSNEVKDQAVDIERLKNAECDSDYSEVVHMEESPEFTTNVDKPRMEPRRSSREKKPPKRYGSNSEYAGLAICEDMRYQIVPKQWEQMMKVKQDTMVKKMSANRHRRNGKSNPRRTEFA